MRHFYRPLPAGLLLAAVLALPTGARAQFRYGPNAGAGYGYDQTQAVAGAACRNPGFNYTPAAAAWGPYVIQDPVSGFLNGSASVMNAAGEYEIQHQQANMGREQVKSAHLDNRRKAFDEAAYERANTPTLWERQAEDQWQQLQQARNNPPDTEIWNGTSLNLLLANVRQTQATTGLRGALVPLDPDILPHISLITGNAQRSSTMLNNGGKLKWPPELDDPRFDGDRDEVSKLFAQAIQEAGGSDGLSGRTRRALNASLGKLHDAIDAATPDMTPSDNIRAMTYVNQVTASAKMLDDPNIAKQLSGEWAPRGATIGELVENMTRNGQKFGPAGPASKPYYSSLYQSMLAYDLSLARLVGPLPTARLTTVPGYLPGSKPSPGTQP
jgi:hypothetical protein